MKKTTLILAISLALAACATDEAQKPAATAAKPAPASPPPAPAPVPRATQDIQIGQGSAAAKPAPKAPAVINLASTQLFEFNKATLTPAAKQILDAEVVGKMQSFGQIRYVNVNGHADRLGTAQYNQKLSERRANAVRAYLVSKGADASRIETFGFGKTTPVKSCPDQPRKALIECLAPNRRVVVEIQGTPR